MTDNQFLDELRRLISANDGFVYRARVVPSMGLPNKNLNRVATLEMDTYSFLTPEEKARLLEA